MVTLKSARGSVDHPEWLRFVEFPKKRIKFPHPKVKVGPNSSRWSCVAYATLSNYLEKATNTASSRVRPKVTGPELGLAKLPQEFITPRAYRCVRATTFVCVGDFGVRVLRTFKSPGLIWLPDAPLRTGEPPKSLETTKITILAAFWRFCLRFHHSGGFLEASGRVGYRLNVLNPTQGCVEPSFLRNFWSIASTSSTILLNLKVSDV